MALFEHWGFGKENELPHVVAHDNAGLVSLRLLLEHGIKFASLCLIDVVILGPFGLPIFKTVADSEAVFNSLPPNFIEGLTRAYIKSATYAPLPPQIEDALNYPWSAAGMAEGMAGPHKFLQEMIQAHNRSTGSLEKEYSRVGGLVPTKIIWGQNDAWLPVEIAQKLKEALYAEEVVVIEEAGHLIQYDQASKLAVEVGLWLSRYDKNEN